MEPYSPCFTQPVAGKISQPFIIIHIYLTVKDRCGDFTLDSPCICKFGRSIKIETKTK